MDTQVGIGSSITGAALNGVLSGTGDIPKVTSITSDPSSYWVITSDITATSISTIQTGTGYALNISSMPIFGINTSSIYIGAFNGPSEFVGITIDNSAINVTGAGIIGVNNITFADGTVLDTAFPGIVRYSTTQGDNNITLSAEANGKFLHYNGTNGNSWIYVPTNSDVALPIGYTVTIVMDDFNGNRIYVNNDVGPAQANINAVGFAPGTSNYWQLNSSNNYTAIYTIMKVDTDRWVLSGPDIATD